MTTTPTKPILGRQACLDRARQLDGLCRAFEEAWRARAQPPPIEEFSQRWTGPGRIDLLLELIAIDAERRQARGEPVATADYAARFPEVAGRLVEIPPAALGPSPAGPAAGGRFGPYRLVQELGRGGMGVVYEAVHEGLGRTVALKLLLADVVREPRQRRRFEREARTLARLAHPAIVPVHDAGEQGGVPYLAMGYIDGWSLDRLLRTRGRAGEEGAGRASLADVLRDPAHPDYLASAVGVAVAVADGLAYAHAQGVVHRDVKPSNILIGRDGAVWLGDFGLAREEAAGRLTETGWVVGTLRYLAPEALRGHAGPSADVYALGVTLYELLTRQPAGPSDLAVVRDRLSPRAVIPTLPAALDAVVGRATALAPTQRYPGARELAEDLRRARPAVASGPDPGVPRRLGWPRRAPLALGAVLALALVGLPALAPPGGPGRRAGPAPGRAVALSPACPAAAGLAAGGGPGAGERWVLETILPRGDLLGAVWSPDGRAVACWTAAGCVRVYEFQPGGAVPRLARLIPAHEGAVGGVSWSPSGRLVTGGADGAVRIWGEDGGLLKTLDASAGPVHAVASSRDGASVLAGGPGGARLWDVASGKALVLERDGLGAVTCVAWSPDEAHLAGAGSAGLARVWRPDGTVVRTITAGAPLTALAWSPDGRRLVTATARHEMALWGLATGQAQPLPGAGSGLAWHPDGERLAVAEANRVVVLRVGAAGAGQVRELPSPPAVLALEWSRDGGALLLATGSEVRVLADSGRVTSGVPPAPTSPAWEVAWSPDGGALACAPNLSLLTDDGAVTWCRPERGSGAGLAWSPDGQRLGVGPGGDAGVVQVVSRGGDRLGEFPGAGRPAWNADGSLLAHLSVDRRAVLTRRPDGSAGPAWRPPAGTVGGTDWRPGGGALAALAAETLYFWTPGRGAPPPVGRAGLEAVGPIWSPDGGLVATGRPGAVAFHRPGGAAPRAGAFPGIPTALAWSRDGAYLAAGGDDGGVVCFRPDGSVGPTLAADRTMITGLSWGPAGALATCSPGQPVRVWSAGDAGFRLRWSAITFTDGPVSFTPGGRLRAGPDLPLDGRLAFTVWRGGRAVLVRPSAFSAGR